MRKELLTCALTASLSAISAYAVPLNITINNSGALLHSVGIADDTQYKACRRNFLSQIFQRPSSNSGCGATVVLLALGLGLLSGESLRRKLHKT